MIFLYKSFYVKHIFNVFGFQKIVKINLIHHIYHFIASYFHYFAIVDSYAPLVQKNSLFLFLLYMEI